MARFEKTVLIRTPDGKDHKTVKAAEAHMRTLSIGTLAEAGAMNIEHAIQAAGTAEDKLQPGVRDLRYAIRDVFLAAWPRANAGKPRKRNAAPAAGA